MLHTLIDILRNSILITGLVVIMMMMIESLNIESKGLFFKGLRKTKVGQVVIASLLGSIPGCMGALRGRWHGKAVTDEVESTFIDKGISGMKLAKTPHQSKIK